jgi:DinB family
MSNTTAMSHSSVKKLATYFALATFTCLTCSASAQAITGDQIKAQFLKDWQRAKAYTLDYLNTMPADKYSFRPVDSIRSFAEQMLHLAWDNVFLNMVATGKKIDWVPGQKFNWHDGEKIDWPDGYLENSSTAQGKDSVVYYVSKSYDIALQYIKRLDPSKFGEITGMRNITDTRYAWLLKAFEHQTHHRGQTTIYIRLVGVKPPNERLF